MESFEDNQTTKKNRRTVQASTTLSRKYAKRPQIGRKSEASSEASREKSPAIQHFNRDFTEMTASGQMEDLVMEELMGSTGGEAGGLYDTMKEARENDDQKVNVVIGRKAAEAEARAEAHPIQISVNTKMRARTERAQAPVARPKVSAKELKDQAIRKALASANRVTPEPSMTKVVTRVQKATNTKKAQKTEKTEKTAKITKIARPRKQKVQKALHFGFGRVMLALSCATAAVAAIVYFVNLNMPDLSLRVAAMQTGIDPTYPTYVPRNYSVSGITSKEGEIQIEFINSTEGKHFTLVEEKSSWDTNALMNNFVKSEYGEDYSIVKEQGLTIYISGSCAAWVNGGNVYKIEATANTLTNKQIRSIAVSL